MKIVIALRALGFEVVGLDAALRKALKEPVLRSIKKGAATGARLRCANFDWSAHHSNSARNRANFQVFAKRFYTTKEATFVTQAILMGIATAAAFRSGSKLNGCDQR